MAQHTTSFRVTIGEGSMVIMTISDRTVMMHVYENDHMIFVRHLYPHEWGRMMTMMVKWLNENDDESYYDHDEEHENIIRLSDARHEVETTVYDGDDGW